MPIIIRGEPGTCTRVASSRSQWKPTSTCTRLYTLLRYVERNALRAGLVQKAENWRWSSLGKRHTEDARFLPLLHPWPIAVGLFVAMFSVDHCLPPTKWRRAVSIAALAVLCSLLLWVSYVDLSDGYLSSYELPGPCGGKAIDTNLGDLRHALTLAESELAGAQEKKTPDEETNKRTSEVETARARYQAALAPLSKSGVFGTFAKANRIVPVSVLLTLAFELFCLVFLWYVLMGIFNGAFTDGSTKQLLVFILLLLTIWIPARAYANYCEREVGGTVTDAAVIFAAVLVMLVFAALFILDVIDGRISWEIAKYLLGLLVASITFMVVSLPRWVATVKVRIDEMSPAMLAALCLVASAALIVLVCRWFGPLSRQYWVAKASTSADGTDPNDALRDIGNRRWATGTKQIPGLWFEVDMGSAQVFRVLLLDSGTNWPSDYPREYAVYVSNTDNNWEHEVSVTSGSGIRQVTKIALTQVVTARYIRILQTGNDPNYWWSIQDFNLYRY